METWNDSEEYYLAALRHVTEDHQWQRPHCLICVEDESLIPWQDYYQRRLRWQENTATAAAPTVLHTTTNSINYLPYLYYPETRSNLDVT